MVERKAATLDELARELRSSDSHLLSFLNLLEARFKAREQEVKAFVQEPGRFDRLRHEAEALAERFPDLEQRPPLYGIPVGIKDVFHVQGFLTRAGSKLPAEELYGLEAESVATLKAAGALILGKTVSTEFAYFGPGPTQNPRAPGHTPGGSSSGSAAAVGAGLCPLALGTQTIGSVSRPAAFCGVAGYKPSYDRISRSGLIPLSPSLDHVGIFTASAASIARVASTLCRGWKSRGVDRKPVLAVPVGPYLDRAGDSAREHFAACRQRLESAGYAVHEVPVMADLDDIEARHGLVVAAEAARVHATWFGRYVDRYHPKTAELVQRGQGISADDLNRALKDCHALRQELGQVMSEHEIDLWISPAAPGGAPAGLDSTGDPVMNLPWSQSGLPTLTVPAGRDAQRLPLGFQLTGRWWSDETLLAWGVDIEEALSR
ncbi:MAG: amidase [Acidobacteriota bacterium]